MNITWNPSPNFTTLANAVKYYGKPRTMQKIVLHWWDDPKKNPTLQGAINTFKIVGGVSAHYLVDNQTIVQMVTEENIAWHARDANPYSIGIEINPKTPGDTYKTVSQLVADICKRRGIAITRQNIIGHREVVNTQCPGTIDIDRVIREAKQGTGTSVPSNQGGGGMANMYTMPSGKQVDVANIESNKAIANVYDEVMNRGLWDKKSHVEKRIAENYVKKEDYQNLQRQFDEYKKNNTGTQAADPKSAEKLRLIDEATKNDPVAKVRDILKG